MVYVMTARVRFLPSEEQGAEIRRRYLSGEHTNQIAPCYGVHGNTIRSFLIRSGIRMRSQSERTDGKIPRDLARQAVELCKSGCTLNQISAYTGVKKGSLPALLHRNGIPKRPSTKRFKLSLEQRKDLAKEYESGATYRELERKYDITCTIVNRVLKDFNVKRRTNWIGVRVPPWTDRLGRVFSFKSRWEQFFAEHLDRRGLSWDYEPCTFHLNTCRCYTPDFRVRFGSIEMFFEVHAQAEARFLNKIREFLRTYPDVRLEVLGPAEMACLGLIEGWYSEHHEAPKVTAFARWVLEQQGLQPIFASRLESVAKAA